MHNCNEQKGAQRRFNRIYNQLNQFDNNTQKFLKNINKFSKTIEYDKNPNIPRTNNNRRIFKNKSTKAHEKEYMEL